MDQTDTDRIADALSTELGSDLVLDEPTGFVVDGRPVGAAAAPRSLEQLSEVLSLAHARGWAVVPAGAGRWLSVGSPLDRCDLVITTRRMDRVIAHEPDDLLATVEAGVGLAALAETLAEHGQWWPLDPPGDGTVGATVATGSAGPLALGFGTPRDLLLGLTVVLADGRVVRAGGRVVKNVAGYDLVRLFTGSWGTLGVIAGAHLRLHPRPPAERTALIEADRPEPLIALLGELDAGEALAPSAAELVSPAGVEALNGATHGDARGGWRLAVRWLGHGRDVDDAWSRADRAAGDPGLEAGSAELWDTLGALGDRLDSTLTLAIRMPRAEMPTLVGLARSFGGGVVPPLVAGPAAGRAGILVGASLYGQTPVREWVERIERLRRGLTERGGRARVERAPIEVRREVDVWGDPGPAIRLHRGVRARFDPDRVLSPGRFVGGS